MLGPFSFNFGGGGKRKESNGISRDDVRLAVEAARKEERYKSDTTASLTEIKGNGVRLETKLDTFNENNEDKHAVFEKRITELETNLARQERETHKAIDDLRKEFSQSIVKCATQS